MRGAVRTPQGTSGPTTEQPPVAKRDALGGVRETDDDVAPAGGGAASGGDGHKGRLPDDETKRGPQGGPPRQPATRRPPPEVARQRPLDASQQGRYPRRLPPANRSDCLDTWPPPLTDSRPVPGLFWMHTPKTGTTFRRHVFALACPESTLSKRARASARGGIPSAQAVAKVDQETSCRYRYHVESLKTHVSFQGHSCGSGVTFFRDAVSRLVSSFHFGRNSTSRPQHLMGIRNNSHAAWINSLPDAEAIRAYARVPEVRNVQTKMILGIGRYDPVADDRLNVTEAIRRLQCFCFIGLVDRWADSLALFNRTMTGADVTAHDLGAITNVGRYGKDDPKKSGVAYLDDYHDHDVDLYAAARAIFDARWARRDARSCAAADGGLESSLPPASTRRRVLAPPATGASSFSADDHAL